MLIVKKTIVGLVCRGVIEMETKKPESHLALKSQGLLLTWVSSTGLLASSPLPRINNGILIGKTRGCGW